MDDKKRTAKSIMLFVEQKLIEYGTELGKHGLQLNGLAASMDNHLKHHEERLKEKRKLIWAIFVAVFTTVLVSIGSLIVGLTLLKMNGGHIFE